MGFTFVFCPFTIPYELAKRAHRRFHKPKVVFYKICRVCGRGFEAINPRKSHCSRRCWSDDKHIRKLNSPRLKLLKRLRMEAAKELCVRGEVNQSLVDQTGQLGTFVESLYLKTITVKGQPRIHGAIWLQKQIEARVEKAGGGVFTKNPCRG